MNAEWTILFVLGLLTALNSVVLIALARQVGVLHLRLRPLPALVTEEGPSAGSILTFEQPISDLVQVNDVERILFGFFSPTCSLCGPLLPSFQSLMDSSDAAETVVLVTDTDKARATQYLARKRVGLPVIAEPSSFTANQIPGAPFAIVSDRQGSVLAAGGVNSLEQIEWLMSEARIAQVPKEEAAPVAAAGRTREETAYVG